MTMSLVEANFFTSKLIKKKKNTPHFLCCINFRCPRRAMRNQLLFSPPINTKQPRTEFFSLSIEQTTNAPDIINEFDSYFIEFIFTYNCCVFNI